ncbi:MAG TPA: suppressor of fused domain protein [Bryobacteraceae bacterium]|nr:suppressor of fused domain protein [Bryobacteraceae bacterium]
MFDKKKSEQEVTPAGDVIYRYPASSWAASPVGLSDESTREFAELRAKVFERFFGEAHSVLHESLALVPHVDVHTYYRRGADGRDTCTLVTSGMSDLEMNVPAGAKRPRRVELIFYCDEPKAEYAETLRWLAHFPHDQQTWIGTGHTIPNGNPPAPFWGSPILDTILLLSPIVKRDGTLPDELVLGGEPVHFPSPPRF